MKKLFIFFMFTSTFTAFGSYWSKFDRTNKNKCNHYTPRNLAKRLENRKIPYWLRKLNKQPLEPVYSPGSWGDGPTTWVPTGLQGEIDQSVVIVPIAKAETIRRMQRLSDITGSGELFDVDRFCDSYGTQESWIPESPPYESSNTTPRTTRFNKKKFNSMEYLNRGNSGGMPCSQSKYTRTSKAPRKKCNSMECLNPGNGGMQYLQPKHNSMLMPAQFRRMGTGSCKNLQKGCSLS